MEVAIVIAIILMVAAAGGGKGGLQPGQPLSIGRAAIVSTGQQIGLPSVWIDWLVWVAKGESNWSPGAHNRSKGERRAAYRAYDRLVKEGRWPCPPVPSQVETDGVRRGANGSGGWYGQLYPYTVLFGHPRGYGCDPLEIWRDPGQSTRTHLRQVRGTISGYLRRLPADKQTFLHLRALYGLPSRINDFEAIDNPQRRAAYTKTLRAAGLDPALLDAFVPDLPQGVTS